MKSDEPPPPLEDPVTNAIYGGIKEDIKTLLNAERFRGALLLIYAGIDCMASIGMAEGQEDVTRDDFVAWAERYIQFPGKQQLSGRSLFLTPRLQRAHDMLAELWARTGGTGERLPTWRLVEGFLRLASSQMDQDRKKRER